MEIKRFFMCSLIGVMVMAMMISSVFASWTRTGYSGSWDNVESPALLSYQGWNQDPAYANFTYGHIGDISDGYGFQIDFNVTVLGNRKEWWWWEGTKRFYFALGLHGSNDAGYSLFYIAHEQGIVLKTSEAIVGTHNRINVGKPLLQIGETVDTINAQWRIQFIRINATTLRVVYATFSPLGQLPPEQEEFWQGAITAWSEDLTVDSSVFTDPELILYAGHDGSGNFTVTFSEPQIGEITQLSNQLPEGLNPAPWQWITDGINFLLQLVTLAGQTLGAFLPVLPFFFLFWIIDAGITSAQQGSFTPVGNCLQAIWDLLVKVYEALANLGKLIWDIISFWT